MDRHRGAVERIPWRSFFLLFCVFFSGPFCALFRQEALDSVVELLSESSLFAQKCFCAGLLVSIKGLCWGASLRIEGVDG